MNTSVSQPVLPAQPRRGSPVRTTPRSTNKAQRNALLILAGLTLVWGCNFPVIKIALAETPVWWFRAACVVIGGVGLLTISAATGARIWPKTREIPQLLLAATFAILCWHIFTGYGILKMPAGRASIIAYTMPLWAAIYSSFISGERFAPTTLLGLVLGLSGLASLIGPDLMIMQAAPVGAMAMLIASVCWAFGAVLVKHFRWSMPVGVATGWMLLIGAVPITAGALALEPFPDVARFRFETWAALAYIFLLPMIFGQWAFYSIVQYFSATIAGISTLAVPVIGVFASSLLIGEPIGLRELVALGLILAALACVLILPALTKRT